LLLSIALSSVRQSRFYHPLFVQDKNGLLFNNKVAPFSLNNFNVGFFKVGTFSLINWVLFHL
jgi:hypothetical protein